MLEATRKSLILRGRGRPQTIYSQHQGAQAYHHQKEIKHASYIRQVYGYDDDDKPEEKRQKGGG